MRYETFSKKQLCVLRVLAEAEEPLDRKTIANRGRIAEPRRIDYAWLVELLGSPKPEIRKKNDREQHPSLLTLGCVDSKKPPNSRADLYWITNLGKKALAAGKLPSAPKDQRGGTAARGKKSTGRKPPARAANWSLAEVNAIIAVYFEMLRCEMTEESYSKAKHLRSLARKVNSRSRGSIEYKLQNISAVLISLGLPYVNGYKPMGHY